MTRGRFVTLEGRALRAVDGATVAEAESTFLVVEAGPGGGA